MQRIWLAAVLAVVVAGAVGFVAAAAGSARGGMLFGPPNAVIATIDLETIFSGLDERMAKQDELEKMGKNYSDELTALYNTGKDEESKAKMLPEGAEKRSAVERLGELQLNIRMKEELYKARLDQRRSEMFRVLYGRISDAAKRMAQANKYTIVIASDESVKIPTDAPTNDVQRAISLKRLVYVDPAHDVSAELITMMNLEFKAAGGVAPPAKTPAPAAAPAGK